VRGGPVQLQRRDALVSVTDGASTSTFVYNWAGDCVSQTVDGTLTTYVLDTATPLTMVLAETTGEESILYMNDGMRIIGQSDGAAPSYFLHDGLDPVRSHPPPAASCSLTASSTLSSK